MEIDEDSRIKEESIKAVTFDGKTLLQVDATSIVGVLFFLSLFPEEGPARAFIGTFTATIVIPFAISAMAITLPHKKKKESHRLNIHHVLR